MADYRQEMIGPLMQRMGVGRPAGTRTGMGMTPPSSQGFMNPALRGLNTSPMIGQLSGSMGQPPQNAAEAIARRDSTRKMQEAQQSQNMGGLQQTASQIMGKYGMPESQPTDKFDPTRGTFAPRPWQPRELTALQMTEMPAQRQGFEGFKDQADMENQARQGNKVAQQQAGWKMGSWGMHPGPWTM